MKHSIDASNPGLVRPCREYTGELCEIHCHLLLMLLIFILSVGVQDYAHLTNTINDFYFIYLPLHNYLFAVTVLTAQGPRNVAELIVVLLLSGTNLLTAKYPFGQLIVFSFTNLGTPVIVLPS